MDVSTGVLETAATSPTPVRNAAPQRDAQADSKDDDLLVTPDAYRRRQQSPWARLRWELQEHILRLAAPPPSAVAWPDASAKSARPLFGIDRTTRAMMLARYPQFAFRLSRRLAEQYVGRPTLQRRWFAFWTKAEVPLSAEQSALVAQVTTLSIDGLYLNQTGAQKQRLGQVLRLCSQNLAYLRGPWGAVSVGPGAWADGLPSTQAYPRLVHLDLHNTWIQDDQLASWLRATEASLQWLNLKQNPTLQFGPVLIDAFSALRNLHALCLNRCDIEDEAGHALPLHLLPNLRTLTVAHNALTGRLPLGHIDQPLFQLQKLDVCFNDDLNNVEGLLANFVGSPSLRVLKLNHTAAQMRGGATLAALRLESLVELNLNGVFSVDDGVAARLPSFFRHSLRRLSINRTSVTAGAAARLESELPDVELSATVSRDG